MYAVNKSLSTLVIACLVLFSATIYAGAKYNDNDPTIDIYFSPYYSPYYSPYFYPYMENNVKKHPNNVKTTGFYPRHYVAPDTATHAKNITMRAQEKLCALGYYKGEIDGLIGSQTKAAIGKFQQAKKLPVTYMLDNKTLKALHINMTHHNNSGR